VKTIVFIAPEFFTFHLQLKSAMEKLGYRVYYIPDRPSKHALIKVLIRRARYLLLSCLNSYFRRKISEISERVDEIFIVRGEGLSGPALKEMKSRFPSARVQLYLWDSVQRSRGCKELFPLVDKAWTYDLRDAKKYPNLEFTPNFFSLPEELLDKKPESDDPRWDLVFFGTAHGDRLKVISRIAKALPSGNRFFIYFYFQSPILYWARRLFDPAFKEFKPEQLSLKPKFGREWENIVLKSSAILDVHHTQQGGLTIRALEALAAGFKLITTDASVTQYPFYNPHQILVIDRNNPVIPAEFLKMANDFPIHPSLKQLELPNWLKRFFD
jgi:hypothetical protein